MIIFFSRTPPMEKIFWFQPTEHTFEHTEIVRIQKANFFQEVNKQ